MIPLARTPSEAHVFMEQRPCGCGDVRFDRRSAVVARGETLCSEYTGACATCGTIRTFVFRLPELPMPARVGVVRFGGDTPSELLDPGEWLVIADAHAARTPANAYDLGVAAAAIDEILKFAPAGADRVPDEAFTTEQGRAIRDAEPGRFGRARLEAVAASYRAALREL
jgi:hypothetical protein